MMMRPGGLNSNFVAARSREQPLANLTGRVHSRSSFGAQPLHHSPLPSLRSSSASSSAFFPVWSSAPPSRDASETESEGEIDAILDRSPSLRIERVSRVTTLAPLSLRRQVFTPLPPPFPWPALLPPPPKADTDESPYSWPNKSHQTVDFVVNHHKKQDRIRSSSNINTRTTTGTFSSVNCLPKRPANTLDQPYDVLPPLRSFPSFPSRDFNWPEDQSSPHSYIPESMSFMDLVKTHAPVQGHGQEQLQSGSHDMQEDDDQEVQLELQPKPKAKHAPKPKQANQKPKKKRIRKPRYCKYEGCTKYVVDRGLCIRHGGGKRCYIENCDCRAQNHGLCWKHGGYTMCTVEGCKKRAKSRGMCWSHGGGTKCKQDGCNTIAVSRGRCWAHGGGKRCLVPGCEKPAYRKQDDLCAQHFREQLNTTLK